MKKMPSRRSTKLRLTVDEQKQSLVSDGSDFVVVVAEVTDDSANVRRLAKENIVFSVEGEGQIIGDASIGANPRAVEFGSAPVLIRSTHKAGKIIVKARVQYEGVHAPTSAEIELESVPTSLPFCYMEEDAPTAPFSLVNRTVEFTKENRAVDSTEPCTSVKGTEQLGKEGKKVLTEEEKRQLLIEVERQQTEFGEKHK